MIYIGRANKFFLPFIPSLQIRDFICLSRFSSFDFLIRTQKVSSNIGRNDRIGLETLLKNGKTLVSNSAKSYDRGKKEEGENVRVDAERFHFD